MNRNFYKLILSAETFNNIIDIISDINTEPGSVLCFSIKKEGWFVA
jgi:hypothetical protein